MGSSPIALTCTFDPGNCTMVEPARWAVDAAKFPVAFAQVREDPLLDRWVVDQLGDNVRVAMVASGGCTAAHIATASNVGLVALVDPNPAQIGLCRLKLELLRHATPMGRAAVLGHKAMAPTARQARMSQLQDELQLANDLFGPPEIVAQLGADHCGRYEFAFAEFRRQLADVAVEIAAAIELSDPREQTRQFEPTASLGRRLDQALDEALSLPNLVQLFGTEATNNPALPFSRHFASRIRFALASMPARDNPYLWQMLVGRYSPTCRAPWLECESPKRQPRFEFATATMIDFLSSADETFDFVHLSNILDWLTPTTAAETLMHANRALRRGGCVLVRQLNSTIDIRGLHDGFEWLATEADQLLARDRSFFYRALHLGRKR